MDSRNPKSCSKKCVDSMLDAWHVFQNFFMLSACLLIQKTGIFLEQTNWKEFKKIARFSI
ncbi:MAG: hypothetical protein DWQ10_13130 [Calditrichaeota bacterium]|nr:MAG: hypothetical protein DWQ10_13130 [Calditrichota bacterium]